MKYSFIGQGSFASGNLAGALTQPHQMKTRWRQTLPLLAPPLLRRLKLIDKVLGDKRWSVLSVLEETSEQLQHLFN